MASEAEAAHRRSAAARPSAASSGAAGWLIQLLCLAFAVAVIVADVGYSLWDAGLEPHAGALDASFDSTPSGGGFVRVTGVEPGGAMARESVAAGDRIAFDRSYDYFRFLKAGEPVAFTLDHAGRTSRHSIAVPARTPVERRLVLVQVIFDVANAAAALLGAFIIWRSQCHATSLLLGTALAAFGLAWGSAPFWLSAPAVFPLVFAVARLVVIWAIPVSFYAFALRFREDYGGSAKTWEWAMFWAYALAHFALTGVMAVARCEALILPVIGGSTTATDIGSDIGLIICLGYLLLGWRRSSAGVQQRYALMLVGVGAMALAQVAGNFLSPAAIAPSEIPAALTNSILGGVIGPSLLTYAILRQKVFDLGFAVNRTLIYAVVSAILLAAFGLIEWAVEHFVPIEGREKNALVDAAVAVGVFLTFHRVRDGVEHVIERLFFRRWQTAEAELRRFVKEAAFATRSETLTRGFAAAMTDYAECAQAAVYLLDDGAGYRLAGGAVAGVGEALDPDDPALMAMRAEPKAIRPDQSGSSLKAALAAPMVNRNEVIGLVLLGPKPSDLDYRPDEVELIGWAARQVGLDLHALKVEQLERKVMLLEAKLDGALAASPQPA